MQKKLQKGFQMKQCNWWILMIIMLLMFALTSCGEAEKEKSNVDVYKSLEENEDEFVIFFDPSAYMLLQSFKENHPNIEIKMVQIDPYVEDNYSALKEMIDHYGPPDLILGRMGRGTPIDLYDLPHCYEKGYIADLSVFTANDSNLDIDAYFPGTFDVFREKDHLYAVPLGISMDFMLTSESKYESSGFAELEEGYTGRELLDVWMSEIEKEREEGEFFCPEYFSTASLLYQLGAITQTEEKIQVDEDFFRKVYEFNVYEVNEQRKETRKFWAASGKQFDVDNGYVENSALEPRMYEGKFTVSLWSSMDAPGLAMSYATTANQYHLDEGTKAIYFPNIDDGNTYTAKVEVYGAVGAESRKIELAYELLRILMDEEINYFQNVSGSIFGGVTTDPKNQGLNFYPVNKAVALEHVNNFEQRNNVLFYEQLGSGRFLQTLDRVDISDEEKVKHEKMLNGITGMYYWNESMLEVSNIIAEYQSMDIKDYTASYAEVVQLLNSNLTGDAGRNETEVEDSNDSTADAEEEKSAEEIKDENDENPEVLELKNKIKEVKVGDTFFFGEVEQDNNLENGAEPIEWIVLEKNEDRAFVISKKILERLTFSKYVVNKEKKEDRYAVNDAFTWNIEKNQQRTWLTNELYEFGFSEDEKAIILVTHSKDGILSYDEYDDYLYIPSMEEIEEYMPDINMRKAEMTAYAAEKANQAEGEFGCWSLRSIVMTDEWASWKYTRQITEEGELGVMYTNALNGVRPVMWLDIS